MFRKKDKYVVSVAGAAGTVGRELVEVLEERNFPVADLMLLDSTESEGERLEYRGKNLVVRKLAKDAFAGVDIAFFSAGPVASREFASAAVKSGALVIDTSSAFRMEPGVPLVVPDVNGEAAARHAGIIASPNSIAVALAAVLKPIHERAKIKRVVATTFHSVSGTGKKAMDELAGQTVALLNFRDVETKVYPHQIAFNCLPHVDSFLEDGRTQEEAKLGEETRKILGDESIRMTATAVRVPVFRCHAASLNVETAAKIEVNELRAALAASAGVVVFDDPKKNLYPVAVDLVGKDEVYVGRIREDETVPNGLNLWIVFDNVRKGAALNAVQIAESVAR